MIPPASQPIPQSFQPRLTELGKTTPHLQLGDTPQQTEQIWSRLPGLYWMVESDQLKPAARVLAEHPTKVGSNDRPLPVIVLQPVGAGLVLFHATDDTWRWRYQVGDVYFARYWVQAIRFLSRAKLAGKDRKAELTTDRREYRQGQPVRLRLRFLDPQAIPGDTSGITVRVERGNEKQRVTLERSTSSRGDFEGTLTDPIPGSYHVWLVSPTLEGAPPSVDFTVIAPPGEFERIRMDAVAMRRAADDSHGKFFTFATASTLLKHVPPGRPVPVESLPPYPLWNKWPVLALCLALLVTEWILRKVKGLL